MPVVGAQGFEVGGVFGVGGRVGEAGEVEGFAAFNTGAAATAVDRAALVTGPGLLKRDVQFTTAFCDIGLAPIDKGAAQAHGLPVAEPDCGRHGIGKFGAAIGVNGVIPVVGGVGDLGGAGTEGIAGGEGKEEHVAVWNDRRFHALLGIMAFRDGDIGGGKAAADEEGTDAGEVSALEGDLKLGADRCGAVEFAGVALPVVDGESLHRMSGIEQVIKEDSGVEAT